MALLVGLGGCGIRLDRVPVAPSPTRQPVADEAALLAALADATRLGALAARVTPASSTTTRLVANHRSQVIVLRDRLRVAGVPASLVQPAIGATGTSTSSPSVTAPITTSPSSSAPLTDPVTPAALAAAEAEGVSAAALTTLAGTTVANRPLLTSLAVARAVAAAALGSRLTWPKADPLPGAAAAQLLDATRAVVYGVEVAAAHLSSDPRRQALSTLTTMQTRESGLTTTAGTAATPDPLGYDLPFPVTDDTTARRLAVHVLTGLVMTGLDPLSAGPATAAPPASPGTSAGTTSPATTSTSTPASATSSTPTLPQGSRAIGAIVRLEAEAVAVARGWGVTPTAFPGLSMS